MVINIPDYDGIGVYAIKNTSNGRIYIGASQNVRKRIKQHILSMSNRTCSQKLLHDVLNGDDFQVEILEKIPTGVNQFYLFEREAFFMDKFDSIKNGYNKAPTTCSSKNELLESLNNFKNNPTMTSYIYQIIEKREKPIQNYNKTYDRINIAVPKGKKAEIQEHAAKRGESVNGFVNRAINQVMEQDAEQRND